MDETAPPEVPMRRGMTLVELMIVIVVSGILLAAVYLAFDSGSRTARRVSESAATQTDARLAFDELEERLRSMGYTASEPPPGWHPLITAGPDLLVFVSDIETPSFLGPEDMVKIECEPAGGFRITDGTGNLLFASSPALTAGFSYRDGNGTAVSERDLAGQAGRDMVRSIDFYVSTPDSGPQAILEGTCSPPNLLIR